MHDGDTLFFQQRRGKVLVVGDGLARRAGFADGTGAARIDVERAFRLRTAQAVRLVQHRHDEIAPLDELGVVLGDEVLRTIQRLDGRRLRDRGWV